MSHNSGNPTTLGVHMLRLFTPLVLALLPLSAQGQEWRTADWTHRIVDEGRPSEHRVDMTESYEFYQGGKSKAAVEFVEGKLP